MRLLSGLFIAVLAFPAFAADGDIFTMPYETRDLGNGLKVIVVETDYPDVVTLQIPVQTGSRNEIEPGKSGFAHFFEHMMFRGTENYSQEEYKEILKNAGADQNAYTTDDYTNYHVNFTKDDLETILMLEADRFQNLSYSEDVFRTEALAVKGEYLKNYSNPIQKALERIRDLAFDEHTYQHTTMGFLKDIEQMPEQYEYAQTFFDRWYRPEKSAIIVVGDVETDNVFSLVEKYWGDWERGGYTVDVPTEPEPTEARYEHVQWEAPTQPWILMAFRAPKMDPASTEYAALDTAGQLFLGQTSDVYKKIVNQDRTADQFFYYFPQRKDAQLFYIGARLTESDNAAQVVEDINTAIADMRTSVVDPQKLEETKANARYSFAGAMDNSTAIGETLAQYVHFDRTPETLNELYRQYDKLTPEMLQEAANKYLRENRMVFLTLSNDESMSAAHAAAGELNAAVAAKSSAGTAAVNLVELPSSSDLIDVSFVFNIGPVLDPENKKGLAALTAAILTDGGTVKMSIDEINKSFFPMATGFDNQVDKEMIRLAGTAHKDNLSAWYAIVSDMLLEPGFRKDDFERLKTQLLNGVKTNLKGNNDEELGKEVLYSNLYGPGHPYGSLNFGHESDIESLTLEDVRQFYRDHFTQANLTLGLAGGYDDAFKQRILKDLAKLPEGEDSLAAIPQAPRLQGRSATIVQKETPAVAVSFGFPIDLRRGDEDWVAMWLARSYLGEHRSSNSHLYQRIREARGMNYGDYAYIEYFPRGMFRTMPNANLGRQQQIFQVWIRPLRTNNDAVFATRTAMFELQNLIDEGLTEAEFETTRNFLEKYVAQMTASQFRQLGYGIDSAYYETDRFAEYVREGLADLTVEDVNRAIRKHLQTDNIHFVFIAKNAEELQEMLINNAESPMSYDAQQPDELLAEDRIISRLDLGLDSAPIVPLGEVFE